MMTPPRVFLFGASLLIAASLIAQSMGTMKAQAQKDLDAADTKLNAVYKQALATRSEKGAAALKEGQRAWITYRDGSCEAYGTGEEGGSLESLMYLRCCEALTKHRTEELKKLYLSDHYPY